MKTRHFKGIPRAAGLVCGIVLLATTFATSASATTVPPLNPAALRAAIAGLPNDEASGALVQVRGSAGTWVGTSGVADILTGRPVPANGRFRIGSMTKTFTATAVLQLAARGRIDLNRTVRSYLPDLLPAGYAPVTIRQLLNYTAGIPGIRIDHKDPTWFLAHRFDTWTPRQLIDLATAGQPMTFAPGTKQDYDNIPYLVLGMVIEKVTGCPYGTAIRDGIIEPLHLSATSVPGTDVKIHGPHAHGYEAVTVDGHTDYVDITEANPTFQWAAAEMISNAPDLDRFLTALVSGRLLPPAQTAELFAIPNVPDYDGDNDPGNDVPAHIGGGLARMTVGQVVFWGKTGDRPGYASGMGTTLDLSRRLVYSVNTLHMGGDLPKVAQRVIRAAA
ncbi:serine hydrolase domain-containing protein [Actinocrispum wychmicini]|uniref:D-alanyl-D-alanine carboxypeptidase n=1 Tax=Actinocrispum wychmicini TaxID=1213861 RepID=A0A4V2S4P0_9PSEU|nr:serine hydrolase domain-containing protein [Actinocrispum wychmicini]TCO48980.1 D-alanyl-D-alanine carboxypeptidase [Actinocrispum wychmicini]